MTPIDSLATQIEELSEEDRASLFALFVVDVERANALAEMQTYADVVESERYRPLSPFAELRL